MPTLSRRQFLRYSALAVAGGALSVIAGSTLITSSFGVHPAFADEALADPAVRGSFLTRFALISDLHIALEDESPADKTKRALRDLQSLEDTPEIIVINGDVANSAQAQEYELMWESAQSCGIDRSRILMSMGNHELSDDSKTYTELSQLFLQQTGNPNVYFDTTINGLHFIVLGPEPDPLSNWLDYFISATQLSWLEEKLADDQARGATSFVLCHEPLHNTVYDTREGQWGYENSIANDSDVAAIINAHHNVVFMSGHTHAYPDAVLLSNSQNLCIASGSVGHCYPQFAHVEDQSAQDDYSYGLVIEVFERALRIKTRNFQKSQWVDDITYPLPR